MENSDERTRTSEAAGTTSLLFCSGNTAISSKRTKIIQENFDNVGQCLAVICFVQIVQSVHWLCCYVVCILVYRHFILVYFVPFCYYLFTYASTVSWPHISFIRTILKCTVIFLNYQNHISISLRFYSDLHTRLLLNYQETVLTS